MKTTQTTLARRFILIVAAVAGCAIAPAQSSSDLGKVSPAEQYRAVKATMQQFYDRGLLRSAISTLDPKQYDIANCSEPGDFTGTFEGQGNRGKDLTQSMYVAIVVVTWENDFRRLGIPEEVWKPLLSSYEEGELRESGKWSEKEIFAFHDRLLAALNGYRAQSNPSLPKFVGRGGCGSGEIEVHFSLSPPDGQLFLIPVFLFKLCEVQRINPADVKACNRWTEVLTGSAAFVVGGYMYQARWSDGSIRCGPLEFKNANVDGKTYSIAKMRSPECNLGW